MNGNNFLIDTNIALYLLSGNKTIANLLEGNQLYISFVTQLELLGFKDISESEKQKVQGFIDECIIIDINEEIKSHVISMRQQFKIKLPDAIVAATSLYLDIPVITADKGFEKINNLVLVLYKE